MDKFLSDRENILAKNAKYGRNRIADRNIESNDGVGGWEYKLTPAGYEKNYKADFLTTKADVAKIRAGKMDEATFNKLKSDLESSEALGYEYKKASDYADMEDFEREFGSLSNPKGGRTINASPHIASGLLGGTVNGADENGNVSPEEFAKGFIYALFGSKITAEGVKRVSPELYNSILGLGKKMPQMAKDNPKLLTKIYGSAKSNSINSFAGEKALNASANKLSKAKAMLEKGEDEVKIWQSTGWYKDKDGAWKFEIDDSPAKIKNQNADKLGDLLEHKELFKAYPELKDIKIKKIIDEKGENLGYYDPNKKEIAINNIGDKSTLMHEVQHAIQDIEGFARGGEYDIVWNAAVRTIEKKYESELAKLEKIANEAWKKEEPLQKAYIELFDKGLKDSPEAQRLLKEREPYFKKGSEANNKIRNIKWAIEDEKNAITGKDMYEAYQKIHGEVEARNVQNRLNLDDAAGTHPHETFDINPNETFVSREGGVNFSKKLPELKEKRGIYNVTYNGKKATWLKQDMANIDNAIRYESGNLSKGAKHISIRHLDDENKVGFVTKEELLNLGKNMRKFIKEYKEPFINDRKARLYEWEDDKGVRFRLVVGNETAGTPYTDELPQPAVSNDIITFYSDRNLKEPMKFENPKLKLLDAIDNSSDKVGLVRKVLLNKDISDGVKAKAVNRLTKNKISQATKNSYTSTKNSNNN
ncbi:LPD23 domain-containing protein [Campylobacter concisus]|uniref:LPD23 domain-containing protein n=1 Tax=Campylobacter concisus TaxID=199 RepID=UPI000CD8C3FE|nr:LPD23 domain-containing protein [Campylobacter concisus]